MNTTKDTMTGRLDRFVRWFFNSSPMGEMIEPHASERWAVPKRPFWVRRVALGGAMICALVVLAVFYSVVAAAVERASAKHRDVVAQAVFAVPVRATPTP